MAISLSSLGGLFALLFNEPAPGWSTVWHNLQVKNFYGAFQSAVAGTTGLRLQGGGNPGTTIEIHEVINPLDFRSAGATKVGAISKFVISLVKKYAGNPISGIPILKDILSFS